MRRDDEITALMDEMRHGPFPQLIIALVFEGVFTELVKQHPNVTREQFLRVVREIDAEISSS